MSTLWLSAAKVAGSAEPNPGALTADHEGFSINAAVACGGHERDKLERFCRPRNGHRGTRSAVERTAVYRRRRAGRTPAQAPISRRYHAVPVRTAGLPGPSGCSHTTPTQSSHPVSRRVCTQCTASPRFSRTRLGEKPAHPRPWRPECSFIEFKSKRHESGQAAIGSVVRL